MSRREVGGSHHRLVHNVLIQRLQQEMGFGATKTKKDDRDDDVDDDDKDDS